MVSIIILTFNNLELTRMCLESIVARTHGIDFEVVLVDNASSDETPPFLREFAATQSNIKVLLNKTNLGFAGGNNLGVSIASGDTLVFLNNDTVVTDGWLDGLLHVLEDPTVGMVGPVTNEIGNESCIEVDYTNLDDMPEFARRYTQSRQGMDFEIDVLAFFCVALRRKVFEEVGPLDEQFGIGFFEDDDYAIRLKQHGYRLVCTEEVFIHHLGNASFSALGLTQYWQLFDVNRQKFEAKWGIEWQPHLKRPELLRGQFRQMVDSTSWHVSMIGRLQQQLDLQQLQLDAQQQQLGTQQQQLVTQQRQLDTQQEQLHATEQALHQANIQVRTLADIYASRSWKLILFLRRIRLTLAPVGSRREHALVAAWHAAQAVYSGISKAFASILAGLTPTRISWYGYAFERYQQKRETFCTQRLSAIRCPTKEGLVSIVLPVYNGANFVAESIETVLNQTYPYFELIIVDDGSTDNTPRILNEFASRDPRICVLSQQNQRLPRALSNGFQVAQGEFLTWTSADNRLKPDFLRKMVDCLHRHPEWEFIYANQDIIGDDGAPLRSSNWFLHYQQPPGSEHIMLPVEPVELNVYPNNYVGGAFMYRDRVAALIGGYSPWRFGIEDYDYWMRVNALLTLRHTDFDDPVYEYRFHRASLTSQDEQLGITRNRVRLMVFDDFRRDFYLTPLIWWIDTGDQPAAKELADKLRLQVVQAGQSLFEQVITDLERLPKFWTPIVYVRITDQVGSDSIAGNLNFHSPVSPKGIMKVLVMLSNDTLPESIDPDWDVCIRTIGGDNLAHFQPPGHAGFTQPQWLGISDLQTLFTAIDIRARCHYLEQIEAFAENTMVPGKKISVVICTYRRGAALAESLRSVAQQSFSAQDFEIIVVNNDPSDRAVNDVIVDLRQEFFGDNPEQIKNIHCPLKGLSFARNAGIAEANGEVICFLDDDAIAKPDWLAQIWQSFCDYPEAGVVGGPIRLNIPQPRPAALKPGWEKFWSQYLPEYEKPVVIVNWWERPWGANWSAKRKALVEIGGFRSQYGRRGFDFGGGEELVAAQLIQSLGYQIVVTPWAEVTHFPEVQRFTWKHVWLTIRAGKRNQYYEQIDLYLPMELSLRNFVYTQTNYLKLFLKPRSTFYQRLEAAYYSWIEFTMTFRWLYDCLARFRKPAKSMRK